MRPGRLLALALLALLPALPSGAQAAEIPPTLTLPARLVATGLGSAHGLRQVGRFHAGGPMASNPEFMLRTRPGEVLAPQRLLVAVAGNLGNAPGQPGHAGGAILSIDPDAATPDHPLAVPAQLAPGQRAAGGAVQLYSVQAGPQLNRQHNAGARTAAYAGTSGPRYLSINNAFGRPWVANAPFGLQGPGSESVLDPDGAPLANAPSDASGGVFVGDQSGRSHRPRAVRSGWLATLLNREPSAQLTPGTLDRGALGTAFLGASPDGSGFAVFAAVTGTGAVVQVHVQDGVDGLAPAGTLDLGGEDPGLVGTAFQWVPERALYLADARLDRLTVLSLGDDQRHFTLRGTRHLASPWLHGPVDLAPCVPELANPRFASHTTLAGGTDLYVVNRGDGSLLRMATDGTVLARALVQGPDGQPVGPGRLRALAVSADAQRLWLVAGHAGRGDELIEVPGFDARGAFGPPAPALARDGARSAPHANAAEGERLFAAPLTLGAPAGTRFNAPACLSCHPGPGGASAQAEHFARRVARLDPVSGRPLAGSSGLAPRQVLAATGAQPEPLPREANVVSLRMPLSLAASGRLDEIPDAVIEAQAVSKGDGIQGRVHRVTGPDGVARVGRYGWKADIARLDDMVRQALGNELGLRGEAHAATVQALSAYLQALPPPRPARLAQAAPTQLATTTPSLTATTTTTTARRSTP